MKAENYGILVLYVAMVFIIFGLNLPLPQDDLMRDIICLCAINGQIQSVYII